MPATATCVVDARASAGESPVWSVGEQCLWWVDIWGRRLHRYDGGLFAATVDAIGVPTPCCRVALR